MKKALHILLLIPVLFCAAEIHAQYLKLRGTVYDSSGTYPLVGVSVLTTAGRGTASDIFGRYEIDVKETDSVWFSYLNKPTIKFAIAKIFDAERFDIALHINIPVLKEVIVRPRNYKLDSLRNREDYAKVFNWEKPRLQATTGSGPGASVGFDLDEIIRMFQFRKNKSMLAFRERLLQEEKDKFIEHRFSKVLVMRLTGLVGAERDSFMLRYRPSYEFCIETGEYDFQAWIKKCFEKWKLEKTTGEMKKEKL